MKHIVFVIGNYKNGGVPMRSTNLANEFAKRGYKSTILVTKEIGTEIYFTLHENVELVSLTDFVEKNAENTAIILDEKKRDKRISYYKRIRYFTSICSTIDKKIDLKIRCIRWSNELRKYMILNQDAVYIAFGSSYYEKTYYASLGLKSKVIYAERNAPELEIPTEPSRARNFLEIVGKANGAVFQTKDEKDFYNDYIEQNVKVIHNPIKSNLPMPHNGKRKPVIINYCRIAEQKNLKLLVEAFIILNEEYPEYHLEIYGNAVEKNEEMLRDELREYVKKRGMQNRIHILPPISDVHKKAVDCAMFVSSSDFEGLSNSMIEAMAIGLPCVCTDCLGGGAREVIENEENGLLVPIKDVDALYKGMKKFIDDSVLAEKCGRNAARIREEQSVEKIADEWIAVIEQA